MKNEDNSIDKLVKGGRVVCKLLGLGSLVVTAASIGWLYGSDTADQFILRSFCDTPPVDDVGYHMSYCVKKFGIDKRRATHADRALYSATGGAAFLGLSYALRKYAESKKCRY